MMSIQKKIWTSEAWFSSDYTKHITFENPKEYLELFKNCRAGKYVDQKLFPKEVYPAYVGRAELSNLFLFEGGLVMVSERLADLMRSFDFGQNQLIEVELYDHSRKVRQTDRYFILNITEKKKDCFVFEQSKGPFDGSPEEGYRTAPNGFTGIAVRESAVIGGVDLWMDPILHRTPFFSGRLGEAIKKGKFGRTGLKPCVVIS